MVMRMLSDRLMFRIQQVTYTMSDQYDADYGLAALQGGEGLIVHIALPSLFFKFGSFGYMIKMCEYHGFYGLACWVFEHLRMKFGFMCAHK